MKKGTYFISGIDTNIGKSIATGWLARNLQQEGASVVTQKMIQTGNTALSEDIELHRKIMGMEITPEDESRVTCPIILTYPASPHLAAQIDGVTIETEQITTATHTLEQRYDIVLLEGAGGLMVPLSLDIFTIDYVQQQQYPVILVTSGRLGSINHTILSIEALLHRHIELHSIIYNRYPQCDRVIEEDSLMFLKHYLQQHSPTTTISVMEEIEL